MVILRSTECLLSCSCRSSSELPRVRVSRVLSALAVTTVLSRCASTTV
jgi:hypothetical protein